MMTAAEKDRYQSRAMGHAAALDGDRVPTTETPEYLEHQARYLFPRLDGELFRQGLAEARDELAEDAP
jgi:hypothetical protein